jgi:hypothetical protein
VISGLLSKALAEEASAAKLETSLAREAPEIPAAEISALAELLERYLNGIPNALDALTAIAKEQPFGRSVAFAAGQVLVYLVDEDDLFGDEELGALGLLDDAYLIHACLAALRSAFPELSVPANYEPPDERSLAAVRALLPPGVADALDRTLPEPGTRRGRSLFRRWTGFVRSTAAPAYPSRGRRGRCSEPRRLAHRALPARPPSPSRRLR